MRHRVWRACQEPQASGTHPELHVRTVWLGRATQVPRGRRAASPSRLKSGGRVIAGTCPTLGQRAPVLGLLFWNLWEKSVLFLKALPTIKPCLKGALSAKAGPRWASDTQNCKIPAQLRMPESFTCHAAWGLARGASWRKGVEWT